jgi:hypothetical protein
LVSGYSFGNNLPTFEANNINFSNNSIKKNVWPSTPSITPSQQNTAKRISVSTPVATTYNMATAIPDTKKLSSTSKKPIISPAINKLVAKSIEPITNYLDLSSETISRVEDEAIPYEPIISTAVNN